MGKKVILLATHIISKSLILQYRTLKKSLADQADLFLLLEDIDIKIQFSEDIQVYNFSMSTLKELKYKPIFETIIPSSNHFPVLQFYRDFPDYDYYWNIEYDIY